MRNPLTLVLGATGKTGRRVLDRLASRGHAVRAGSRRSEPAFDWDDARTWTPALAGVESLYVSYFPDLAVPGAPEAIEKLTACAVGAGVRRIVLLSGRGEPNAQRCEEIVLGCGVDATVIRASWFAQNFDEGVLLGPVLSGTVSLPARDVREPFVDVDDIADVAVAALTDERHAGQLYEVTGPRLLSFDEVVAAIGSAAGREIRFATITAEQYCAELTEHAGPAMARMLTDLMGEVLDGRNEWVGDGVQRALGREPRDFADYARAAAATGVWGQQA